MGVIYMSDTDRDGAWVEVTANDDRTIVEVGVRHDDDNGDYTVAVLQIRDHFALAAALLRTDLVTLTMRLEATS